MDNSLFFKKMNSHDVKMRLYLQSACCLSLCQLYKRRRGMEGMSNIGVDINTRRCGVFQSCIHTKHPSFVSYGCITGIRLCHRGKMRDTRKLHGTIIYGPFFFTWTNILYQTYDVVQYVTPRITCFKCESNT